MDCDAAPNTDNVVSVYRIDLTLLSLGPVHHAIELKRAATGCFSSGSQYSARLSMDVKFVQTQKIEVQLAGLQAKVDDKLKDAYRAGFTVVTQKDVTESIKSFACTPQV